MGSIIIDGVLIETSLETILNDVRTHITNGKLKEIRVNGDDIVVTCPHHSGGAERRPSCGIYIGNSGEIEYGVCHCFTCGFSVPFYRFIAESMDKDDTFAKLWLVENYGKGNVSPLAHIPPIELNNTPCKAKLDESILDKFESFHPYMLKRKLDINVCNRFKIKYDPISQSLVFPVWDEKGNLTLLTRRSVNNKTFLIDKDAEKPVYLLNYILSHNLNEVVVCESQINCLYAWSLGFPAIALFGTGSNYQYNILNKSGILHYILCLDGDEAGDKGVKRFLDNINKSTFVDVIRVPRGKDLNDLGKEEATSLLSRYVCKS